MWGTQEMRYLSLHDTPRHPEHKATVFSTNFIRIACLRIRKSHCVYGYKALAVGQISGTHVTGYVFYAVLQKYWIKPYILCISAKYDRDNIKLT